MLKRKLTKRKIRKFEEYLIREEKSRATVEMYTRDVKKLYAFLPGDKMIRREQLRAFKKYLLSGYQDSSVNSMLAGLNCYLRFAGLSGLQLKTVRIQKQIYRMPEQELSAAEYKRLLTAAKQRKNTRLYWILQTICGTGIRVSELSYITVEGLQAGSIRVRCKSKSRMIWIPEKLQRHLLAFAGREGIKAGPVFVTSSGKAMDRSNIWRQMKQLSGLSGVMPGKIYPHNLRHLFARCYYSKEKDIVRLADILGHSSIETSRIYTVSTGREHARQIESLGLVV